MGFITSGKCTSASVTTISQSVFAGASSQAEVDQRVSSFRAELAKINIRMLPIPGRDPKLLYTKRGVILENWHFSTT